MSAHIPALPDAERPVEPPRRAVFGTGPFRQWLVSPWMQAELIAAAWESFSALLFISAVVPAAFSSPMAGIIFLGSMALSAAIARTLIARGPSGFAWAAAVRAAAWPIAVSPL